MRLSTVLAATAEPVSLRRAKLHLRVDDDDEDALLNAIIASARVYVEGWTKRVLVQQTLRADLDAFPPWIELPVGPVRSVTSITYLDTDGDSQTLGASIYQTDLLAGLARIATAPSQVWPSTETGRFNAVTVNFVAGMAIPFTTTLGSDVNQLDMVAHPFTNGDTLQLWNSGGELPGGLSALVNYYVVNSATDSIELSLTSGGSPITISVDDGSGAGFAGLLNGPYVEAMLLIIGALWENREQEFTGTISTELKFGVQRLLMPYTHVRF